MDALSFIKQIKNLPTPLPVLRKIGGIVENQESTATQVVDALRLDPVTAGKVLYLANSAYKGIPRKISSLRNAVGLLGLPRIRSLVVVTRHISPVIKKPIPPFLTERYWRHSIAVALMAGSIARHYQRYGAIDEEEAYSAGLLHDIGKLVLAVYKADRLKHAYEQSLEKKGPFYEQEEPEWSHAAVGRLLAALWDLPTEISDAIFGHHSPGPHAMEHARMIAIVHVADVMAHTIGLPVFSDEPVPRIDQKALETVRLPPERLRIIAEAEMENQKKIEEDCGI
jgi:putative nucleotidyltransferase with HDIG domain